MKVIDPVCQKEIDLSDVYAFQEHEGWAYFFCSSNCAKHFGTAPARFTVVIPGPGTSLSEKEHPHG